ncbi:MAG TPA: TetR/AcrR family transcriptional regulator C-terminal domain-containing protein [Baekduia sp.]|nr:TetR/AcrR family transcriptional regulator C-terminal domain-containing protein [Baekduia sp.]
MAAETKTRKRPSRRTPLTRELVLRTAMALADEQGLEQLTMRSLAKELGVEAMSLYNHVANKDDLLDGMIDLVFGEIEPPLAGGDWKAELRRRAVSTRAALLRHRWAVGEMEGRTSHGLSNLRIHDAVLGVLLGAGFSEEMSVHAYSVQDAYIYGFALQQTDMSSQTPEDFAAVAQRQMADYAAVLDDFPNLVQVVGGHVAKVGYDYDKEFLYGLDLILEGLERLLASG